LARRTLETAHTNGVVAAKEARKFWLLWLKDVEEFKDKWVSYQSAFRELAYIMPRDGYADEAILKEAESCLSLYALFDDFGRPLSVSSALYSAFQKHDLVPVDATAKYSDSQYNQTIVYLHQHWSTIMTLHALRALSVDYVDSVSKLSESVREAPRKEVEIREYLRSFCERYRADPFALYDLSAADQELYKLIRESRGPDDFEVPWFASWLKRLPSSIDQYETQLSVNVVRNPVEHSADIVTSVDATIKRAMVTIDKDALEPDAAFVQRLFEKRWIENLASKWNTEKNSSRPSMEGVLPRLNETTLESVIQCALPGLSARGYVLNSPGQTRLRVLLDKMRRHNLGYSERPEW
jgi:hypothetical protein